MKYSVFIFVAVLCISSALAKKDAKKSKPENPKKELADAYNKGKREIPVHPYPPAGPPRSSHLLHLQPAGGSSLSIGAGYSLGGSKPPSFSYASPGSYGGSHFPGISSFSHGFGQNFGSGGGFSSPYSGPKVRYTSINGFHSQNPNSHSSSGGSSHKFTGLFGGSSGGSHSSPHFSLSSGGPQSFGHGASKPQISYGIPQYAPLAKPETSYGPPSASYSGPSISVGHGSSSSSLPSYASGTHGLGAYATSGSHGGITGPLFTPAHEPSVTYGVPSGSYGASSGSYGSSIGGGGHSGLFSGLSLGGSGGSSFGHGFLSGKKSFGDLFNSSPKPTFENYGSLSSSYGAPSKTEFKPSVYLGSSESSSSNSYGGSSQSHQGPSSSYGAPLSGHSSSPSSAIYLAPKVVASSGHGPSFEMNSISDGSQSDSFHGSASLSGTYEIPSAGHAASSLSFGSSSGGYSSPSVSYGTPSFGHDSDSSSFGGHGGSISSSYGAPVMSHGSGSFEGVGGGHGSFAAGFGGSSSNLGSGSYESPAGGHGSFSAGFGGSSSSHGSESFDAPAGGHGSFSGGFGGGSSSHGAPSVSYSSGVNHISSSSFGGPSSSYGAPSFGDAGHSGSSGATFSLASAGKQELSSGGGHGFGNIGSSTIGSSFGVGGHGFVAPKEFSSEPHKLYGPPKGAFSVQSNVFASPPEGNFGSHAESKYDTIKYSRDFTEEEILQQH